MNGSTHAMKRIHYVQLALYKVYAELRQEVARHYMGIAWWILDPILYMTVFYVIFAVLPIRGRPDEFVSFLLVGLVTWRWLHQGVQTSANSILSNRAIIQLVYVPKLLFPVCSLMSTTFKFLLVLTLLFVYLWSSGSPPNTSYVYLPLVLGTELLLIMGISFFAAAIVPLISDLIFLIQHGLRLAFFVSGIFFAGSQLAPEHQRYFYMNPMARIIESYRDILLDGRPPPTDKLLIIAAVSSIFALLGIKLVIAMDRSFPKIVADK